MMNLRQFRATYEYADRDDQREKFVFGICECSTIQVKELSFVDTIEDRIDVRSFAKEVGCSLFKEDDGTYRLIGEGNDWDNVVLTEEEVANGASSIDEGDYTYSVYCKIED